VSIIATFVVVLHSVRNPQWEDISAVLTRPHERRTKTGMCARK
jgi:hypothetical protein